jgi:4-hydroxy-tetrahydrodipicolinate reductase
VPGDHTVVLSSSNESLALGHSVTTREVFAEGAMRAARWVVGQNPDRYQMRHVLFGES